jgi:NitT/TauT family transport system ATP-binding protein
VSPGRRAAERLDWPADGSTELRRPDRRDGAAIRFDEVAVDYGGVRVVTNITFEARTGEFVAIVGQSGCGKTTCLNLACGEAMPAAGRLTVLGDRPEAAARRLTYMFARDALFPWRDALANVMLALEPVGVAKPERRREALAMLEKVGLAGQTGKFPTELSQGMRQRVALARTFVRSAELMLMDEPFAAVDAQTRIGLQSLLLELWETQRATVLFVTHDLTEAITLADRIVVMGGRPGHVVATFEVDLPRPRHVRAIHSSPGFRRLLDELWDAIEVAEDRGPDVG